jgi:hypothetical protein
VLIDHITLSTELSIEALWRSHRPTSLLSCPLTFSLVLVLVLLVVICSVSQCRIRMRG